MLLSPASPMERPASLSPSTGLPEAVPLAGQGLITDIARAIRRDILIMHNRADAAHIASSLSIVDILTVLYFRVLRIYPKKANAERDRFILSKGHGASALYATLTRRGILPKRYIDSYCLDGGRLCGHCDHYELEGIEACTGSLGHGLSIANGMALACRYDQKKYRVFVLMGDGECDEGSVWEAAMFAGHHRLDAITVIIDRNHFQAMGRTEEIMRLEPLADKWEAFGWNTRIVNGHNLKQIESVCKEVPFKKGRPNLIIAKTIKGKGVSFMEDRLEWHYRSPRAQDLEKAIKELNKG